MTQSELIAIIGMGCRFPGEANDPQAFWRLLADGRDAVTSRATVERSNGRIHGSGAKRVVNGKPLWGGFIEGIDPEDFDATFFRVPPHEAAWMDPQQRWLLETAWQALENACIRPSRIAGRPVGAFVGICGSDHQGEHLWGGNPDSYSLYSGTGAALSTSAGRLAYFFDWQGPCLAIDTACSSSLVALHYACQALLMDECELALAAGVNGLFSRKPYEALDRLGILSAQGRSRAFDASADGYARGEGCGVVILKRLSEAQRDGDRIHAVIRAACINQDGRSRSFTAPNPQAQASLLRNALRKARLSPNDIDYIEAHGTGTPLGDAVEIEAIGEVFSRDRDSSNPLWIGSVKTNIGHLEAAAGIAGLIKTALALQGQAIPKHVGFESPNPRIPWERLPIRVADQSIPWPHGKRPRRAGVSSFGFSGANAHVILEESVPWRGDEKHEGSLVEGNRANGEAATYLLPISAKSPEALIELAQRYVDHLAETTDSIADICYSASVGREHFAHRAAFEGRTVTQIREALRLFIDADSSYTQRRTGDCAERAMRYERGEEIEWNEIYAAARLKKTSIPLYPFQRKRFSLDSTPARNTICVAPMAAQSGCIHARLAETPADSRLGLLISYILDMATQLQGEQTRERVKETAPLVEQGFDSLLSVELREALSEALNLQLPVTLLFNYPTIEAIANYLLSEMLFNTQPRFLNGRNGAGLKATAIHASPIDSSDDELDHLSMEELEKLIESDLRQLQG